MAFGAMDESKKHEAPPDSGRKVAEGTCPRCGNGTQRKPTGRPPIWCSQACRRAAYEERSAAARGAIALEVVDRVETREHPLSTCVDRTIESPVGCRRVIHELARLAREGTLATDPKWESTYIAIRAGLIDAVYQPMRRLW